MFALGIRLAMEVGQFAGLDTEDRLGMSGMLLTHRSSSEAASASATPLAHRRPEGQRRQSHE